jgi:hypothetical protein
MFNLVPAHAKMPDLYAVSYCNRKDNGKWRLHLWTFPLAVGESLPEVPLWLASDFAIPLDLERAYEETNQVLRIE